VSLPAKPQLERHKLLLTLFCRATVGSTRLGRTEPTVVFQRGREEMFEELLESVYSDIPDACSVIDPLIAVRTIAKKFSRNCHHTTSLREVSISKNLKRCRIFALVAEAKALNCSEPSRDNTKYQIVLVG
jgi:hypothetical protein